MGADDLLFPVEIKFDQIAAQDKKKDKEQEKNNHVEGKKQDFGHGCRRKMLPFPSKKFDAEKQNDQDKDKGPNDTRAFFLCYSHVSNLNYPPGLFMKIVDTITTIQS